MKNQKKKLKIFRLARKFMRPHFINFGCPLVAITANRLSLIPIVCVCDLSNGNCHTVKG